MKTEVLGVAFDVVTMEEAINKLLLFLKGDKNNLVFTPNAEMVMTAKKDTDFLNILSQGDLVVPDGIGVVLASKLNKVKIKERIPGVDMTLGLLNAIKDKEYSVYFFGGAPGVAALAKEKMMMKYPTLKIIGVHDGYFDDKEEKLIIEEVKNLKPDILLVGLGVPKQEKWFYKHRNSLPVKISIGVGGSFDVMAQKVKRAPELYQKLGLEWFYRLMKQPSRAVRMLSLPLFVMEVLLNKIKNR